MTDKGFFPKPLLLWREGKKSYKREPNGGRGLHEEERGTERKVWSLRKTRVSSRLHLDPGEVGLYRDKGASGPVSLELTLRPWASEEQTTPTRDIRNSQIV